MQGRLVEREIKNKLQSFPIKNWHNEIRLAKKYKIKFIEWTLDYNKFYENPLIKNPKKVKEILKKNKVLVKTVTCDFFMQKPPFKKENKTTEYLFKLISVSKIIGIKLIVIPLVDNSSIKINCNEQQIINYFKELKKKITLQDVKIIFELDLEPKKVRKFIKKLDNSFGINYDLGNSAFYGYSFNDEKLYFSKVLNVHLKDRNYLGHSVPFGKGLVNFEIFFNYMKKIKYRNLYILQSYIPRYKNSKLNTLQNLKIIQKYHD